MATVFITGTSSGIGLATALAVGRAGHSVYATMRKPEKAPQLAEIAAKERLPITVAPMDVDSDASVRAAFEQIRSQGVQIDVLVNNAGIERAGSIEELPFNEFRAVMETNYFGALRCIQMVLPQMRERKSGCIINVTSVAGRLSTSPLAPYTASKWALEALSEALAQEMKPFNVRVAIVEPGIIDTPMAQRIAGPPANSHYRQGRRFSHMFVASLQNPTPPTVVAEKILEIVQNPVVQLRHPVGPDAEGFLAWRRSMTDEEWIEWNALEDDAWYERVERDFGLKARPLVSGA